MHLGWFQSSFNPLTHKSILNTYSYIPLRCSNLHTVFTERRTRVALREVW